MHIMKSRLLTSCRTRNINNNIDFGLSFPTPTNAQRSKTPSTNRRASRRPTRTPARRSVSQDPAAEVLTALPQASTAKRAPKRKSSFLDAVTSGPEPSTGGKRKLNDSATTPSGPGNQESNSLLKQSIPGRRTSRKSEFIAIAEEPSDENIEALAEEPEMVRVQGLSRSLVELQGDKENDEPSLETTQGKPKKRKSIARKFTRPKKRSSSGSLQEQQAGSSRRVPSERPVSRDEDEHQPEASTADLRLLENWSSNLSGKTLPLSVRHQTGIAIPTKAPRLEPGVLETSNIEGAPSSLIPAGDENAQDEDSIPSVQSDEPAKRRRKRKSILVKKRAGRRLSAQSAVPASPISRPQRAPSRTASPAATPYHDADENEDEDETYIPEEVSPEPPTPAVILRKPRKNARIVTSIEKEEQLRRSSAGSKQSGFPITTHRLVNASALPTITEQDEQASDDELQAYFGTCRTSPNAVDVLAQICRETLASALAAIGTTATGSELKRKTEALESFGKEMDSRLFDMSAAVENRLTLESRVRASKREKTETQARWIEVRRKREEIALRMDRVRRDHWESEGMGAKAWKLSEGLYGVEIGTERERGTETESIEYLLKSVGAHVSGFQGGGMLQRVKAFNVQMERMLEVLDRRGE